MEMPWKEQLFLFLKLKEDFMQEKDDEFNEGMVLAQYHDGNAGMTCE